LNESGGEPSSYKTYISMLASSRDGEKNSIQPVCKFVLTLGMFPVFSDYMKKEIILGFLLVILLACIFYFGIPLARLENEAEIIEEKTIGLESNNEKFLSKAKILLPAVEEEGQGIMAWLTVEVHEGEGRTLLEIDNISFFEDTQKSILVARSIAEKITNTDPLDYDIIYSFNANASTIEGPSAGPAIAIATIIALENKTINQSVIITGYLKENGKIGKVSGVLEKAKVAKQNQLELFLVPLGQKIQSEIETNKTCENDGITTFCKTETFSRKVDIQEEIGIDVLEVESISDALKYFIIG